MFYEQVFFSNRYFPSVMQSREKLFLSNREITLWFNNYQAYNYREGRQIVWHLSQTARLYYDRVFLKPFIKHVKLQILVSCGAPLSGPSSRKPVRIHLIIVNRLTNLSSCLLFNVATTPLWTRSCSVAYGCYWTGWGNDR